MIYDLSLIRNAFKSLLKFKRDYVYTSLVGSLDSDLLGTSDSGLYFNSGVNPLITLKNLESLMPPSSAMSVPTYSASVTYGIDDCVVSASVYYRSKVNSNYNHAVNLTDYWEVTSLMSIWIRSRINSTIETVLGKSISTSPIIDYIRMYKNSTDGDLITNASNYVGYEIRPKNAEHLKLIVNRIATQFSESQSSLTLYLYKQNTQVTTISLSSMVAGELAFTDVTDQEIKGEGRWFLFYDQDDLTGSAYNWNCMKEYQYLDILPFETPNTTTDFINDVSGYTYNSYGLGLDVSVTSDLTNWIIDNKGVFAECIHLQWQYDILELFITNPDVQVDRNQVNIASEANRAYILGELKSDTKFSLASKIEKAYEKLIKSLDRGEVTLPGTNDNFISYESQG
jgi:hypothetical protein